MEHRTELQQKEAQRARPLEEASRIVTSAEAESGTPDAAEDALVLELMTQVRKLEEEIRRLKKQTTTFDLTGKSL
jgi:hypothetical protein